LRKQKECHRKYSGERDIQMCAYEQEDDMGDKEPTVSENSQVTATLRGIGGKKGGNGGTELQEKYQQKILGGSRGEAQW